MQVAKCHTSAGNNSAIPFKIAASEGHALADMLGKNIIVNWNRSIWRKLQPRKSQRHWHIWRLASINTAVFSPDLKADRPVLYISPGHRGAGTPPTKKKTTTKKKTGPKKKKKTPPAHLDAGQYKHSALTLPTLATVAAQRGLR